MRKHFGDSQEEKLPFKMKKPPTELGLERGSHLLWPIGGDGEESLRLIMTND